MGKTIKQLTEELEALNEVIGRVETIAGCPIGEAVQAMSKIRKDNEELTKDNVDLEKQVAVYATRQANANRFFFEIYGLGKDAIDDIYDHGYVGTNDEDAVHEDRGTVLSRLMEYDVLKRKCNNLREALSSLCVAAIDADDVREAIDDENWALVRNAIQDFKNYWYNKTDHVKEVEEKCYTLREIIAEECVSADVANYARGAIDNDNWSVVRGYVRDYVDWVKNTSHIEEVEEKLAKKEKDYDALKELCRRISDDNKDAQETVNKQRDMLDYWHTFTLNHLKWPVYAVDKVEQGYYAEARTSLNAKGFALFAKHENLKKFVCSNCVVAADMDETKAALEAEDWDKVRARVANYVKVHIEAAVIIKDEQLKKLEEENDILKGKNRELLDKNEDAYAYIVNLENFFAKNHGYLDTDFEAIKQTGCVFPRHTFAMDAKFENDILKGKNKELVNENYRLKKENEDLDSRYFAQSFELGQSKMGPHFNWSTASDIYTCDINGTKIIVHKNGDIEIQDGEVSFNVKDLRKENETVKEENKWLVDEVSELRKELGTQKEEVTGFRVKYDHLKNFVWRNCVASTDANGMKEAMAFEDWVRARHFVLKYACRSSYALSEAFSISADGIKELRNENEKLKERLNKIYGTAGDCDSDYPKLHWDHTGTPLLHWDTDTNTYTLNLNGAKIIVHNDGKVEFPGDKIYGAGGDLDGDVIMLPGCKISHNAKAGCYTFDIGGQHIVATNGGHIFIDKE